MIYGSIIKTMENSPREMEKLNISFQWGSYGLHVLKFRLFPFSDCRFVESHQHSNYEFHYIARGKGYVIIENKLFDLKPGMVYLTGPGVIHFQKADEHDPMFELCLHLDIHPLDKQQINTTHYGFDKECIEAHNCIKAIEALPKQPVLDTFECMPLFEKAHQAILTNRYGLYITLKMTIIDLLLRTICCFQKKEDITSQLPTQNINEYRYMMAIQYMKENYTLPLTVDLVANKIHVSSRQLQRIFKEYGPFSFSEQLESFRLEQVCKDLLYSKTSIEDIAYKHGFSSSSYLHYVFKKSLGVTPRQYRNQHKQ